MLANLRESELGMEQGHLKLCGHGLFSVNRDPRYLSERHQETLPSAQV